MTTLEALKVFGGRGWYAPAGSVLAAWQPGSQGGGAEGRRGGGAGGVSLSPGPGQVQGQVQRFQDSADEWIGDTWLGGDDCFFV